MSYATGATTAILALFEQCGGWLTCAEVVANLPDEHKGNAPTLLAQRVKAGVLERRGEPRRYQYRLAGTRPSLMEKAPSSLAAQPVWDSAPTASIATSVGTVCQSSTRSDEYDKQKALRDVLSGMVDLQSIESLSKELPSGWTRSEIIGLLTEGVKDGWITSDRIEGESRYGLSECGQDLEPPQPHPFAIITFEDRISVMRAEVRRLLADGAREDAPDHVLLCLAQASDALAKAASVH